MLGLLACDRQLATPQDSFTVSLEQARQVADHLRNSNVAAQVTGLKQVTGQLVLNTDQHPALYVFNYQGGGFAIVPANKHLMPVVAYSATGLYTNTNKPGGLLMWEQKTAQYVADARNPATPTPAPAINRAWANCLSAAPVPDKPKTATRPLPDPPPPENTETIVGPLLPVTWGQGCSYNNLCRNGNSCGSRRWTGCVITSMAQVLAYWQYPTNYAWAAMPADHGNADVQQLMVDVRDAIPSVDDSHDTGTEAYLSEAANISGITGMSKSPLTGFKNTRFHYASADYITYDYARVKNDLNASRPAILGGCRERTNRALGVIYTYGNCHAWVCDGYHQINDNINGYGYLFFHMNWGWHEGGTVAGSPSNGTGDYNGWYQYNNWNISGNNRNYQYANDAVINIHP